MNAPHSFEDETPGLDEMRALQELARAVLPLATAADVARDGLLCIAGITGIGGGALLWRAREHGPFELLSHFGLGAARLRGRYRLPAERWSDAAPIELETARRRPAWRQRLQALEPLPQRLESGWVLGLHGERAPRGVLLLGRSLVAGGQDDLGPRLAALGEILRLALLGRSPSPTASPSRARGATRTTQRPAAGGRSLARRLAALRRAHPATAELRGASPALLALLDEVVRLAQTTYTVLLQGETGTGKELVARLLHRTGPRAGGPFEAVDCSAIPRELIESELFGHVRGAFTGAARDFQGAFERADGGTLLLDEIGDMDLRSQTRLLRVLQERSVRRLGGDRAVPVDVRVVAASNRDLGELVRAGRFREDLYYRIHVCLLQLPPLRERGDDRALLFDAFMRQSAAEVGRTPRPLSPAARRRLRLEAFPGNVRQLQNVVRQLLVQRGARGPVSVEEMDEVLRRAARAGAHESAPPSALAPAPASPAAEAWPGAPPETPPEPPAPGRVERAPVAWPGRAEDADAPPVDDIGAWVVEQLRAHGFNLRAAARALHERRRMGASRRSVPVFDRGALDYYLCGEFFHRLVRRNFAFDSVIEELAGKPRLVARLRRKARAFVATCASADAAAAQARRRLPEAYHPDLAAVVHALRAGTWQPPAG